MRLVEEVHHVIGELIKEGDFAVDATTGNGHDTLFLAKSGARVIGFDIQELAIENTRNRLNEAGYLDKVLLFKVGHERMADYISTDWMGKVRIVMFNLGYLPGCDKTLITHHESTICALKSAYDLLMEDGYLSIILYPDHEGGQEEVMAVKTWIAALNVDEDGPEAIRYLRPSPGRGPEWFLIRKRLDV